MELHMGKSMAKSKKNQKVPPRRGQIKIKILKSLVKSATELITKKNGSRGSSTPSTATPGETQSGYNSGADSDVLHR